MGRMLNTKSATNSSQANMACDEKLPKVPQIRSHPIQNGDDYGVDFGERIIFGL